MEYSIETVKKSKLKLDDTIVGSFCKATYVCRMPVEKKSIYRKWKTGNENYTSYVEHFHLRMNSDPHTSYSITGFYNVITTIDKIDLRTFREQLKNKSNENS